MKKLIYVASPYRGDVEKNVAYAKECCNFVLEQGCFFYCPHLSLPQILDDTKAEERELALEIGKEMLLRCDEIWVFGFEITEGMFGEIQWAREHEVRARRITDILEEVQIEQCLC